MGASDRSVADVLQDIFTNVQDIVRSEVRLAKTEVREGFTKSARAAMVLSIGVVTAFFGIFFLLFAAVFALSAVMPTWAAALLVAVALGSASALSFYLGSQRLKRVRLAPVTTASIKENIKWTKQQVR